MQFLHTPTTSWTATSPRQAATCRQRIRCSDASVPCPRTHRPHPRTVQRHRPGKPDSAPGQAVADLLRRGRNGSQRRFQARRPGVRRRRRRLCHPDVPAVDTPPLNLSNTAVTTALIKPIASIKIITTYRDDQWFTC